MFKRAYPIQLRPGVGHERLVELHAVLDAAPQYIPGFLVSALCPAGAGTPYDLVWENTFEDEEAFWLYAGHPYHANVINEYLAPDSPGSVKAVSSTGITWDESKPFDSSEILRRQERDQDAGTSADLSRASRALERAGISAPSVFLMEQIELVPGKLEEYLCAMRDIYVPAAKRHGMRLLMSWQSPPDTGEEELTFLWVVPGWGEAFTSFVGISGEVDAMRHWLDTVRPLRRGGRRRYLVPTELTKGSRFEDVHESDVSF